MSLVTSRTYSLLAEAPGVVTPSQPYRIYTSDEVVIPPYRSGEMTFKRSRYCIIPTDGSYRIVMYSGCMRTAATWKQGTVVLQPVDRTAAALSMSLLMFKTLQFTVMS